MISKIRAAVFALLLLAPSPVWAWGAEGHEIVAAIAAKQLTPRARAQVAALLGGRAAAELVLDSNWADEIRPDRPGTATWHYVNIEIGSGGYDARRDCPHAACAVAQIARDAVILAAPNRSRAAHREALLFLIHLVGDLHQPLHAADRHDQGGGTQMVVWRGRASSLHAVWDRDVVTALGRDPMRVAAAIARSITPQQKAQWGRGTPAAWADESFRIATRIYAVLPRGRRVQLPGDYVRRNSAVARLQLAKAGVRLAAILNRTLR